MSSHTLTVDIVSDVVCPWCVIGYKRLERAALAFNGHISLSIQWHPFELTPDMDEEGQNLTEFLQHKYGDDFNGTEQARQTLITLGEQLGFTFNQDPHFIRYNSQRAHQLLHHARAFNLEHELKLQLFSSYFTHNHNIHNIDVLVHDAEAVGLNPASARQALETQKHLQAVRDEQEHWKNIGVHAIPLFILNQEIFLQGAGTTEEFQHHITSILDNPASHQPPSHHKKN